MNNTANKYYIEIGKIALKSTLCLTVILGSVNNIHCGKNNTQANIESLPKSSNKTKTIKKAKSQLKKYPIATKMFRLLQETKKHGKCIIEENIHLDIDKIKKLIKKIQHDNEPKRPLNQYLKSCFKATLVVRKLNYALISKQKELSDKDVEKTKEMIKIVQEQLSQQEAKNLLLSRELRVEKLLYVLTEYNQVESIREDPKLDKNDLILYQKILKDTDNENHKNIRMLQKKYIKTLYDKVQKSSNEDILTTNPPFYPDAKSLDKFILINGLSDTRENLKEVGKLLEAYLLDIIIKDKIKHHHIHHNQNAPNALKGYFSCTEILEYATDLNKWFYYDNDQKQFKFSKHAPNAYQAKERLSKNIINDIIDIPISLEGKLEYTKIIKQFDELFKSGEIENAIKIYLPNQHEKNNTFIHGNIKDYNIIPKNSMLNNEELRPYVLILNHMIDNDNKVIKYFEEYSSKPKRELDTVLDKMLRFFIYPKHDECYSQYLAINVIKFLLDLKVIKDKGRRQIFTSNAIEARKMSRLEKAAAMIADISKHSYKSKTNNNHNGYYIAYPQKAPGTIEPFYLQDRSLADLNKGVNYDIGLSDITHTIRNQTTFDQDNKITVQYIFAKQPAPKDDAAVREGNDESDSVSSLGGS